jgi:hypothetical protein
MCASKVNRLTLIAPPCFIYEARPPPRRPGGGPGHARGRARPRGGDGGDDDEAAAVYGCYVAVTLCDGRCEPPNAAFPSADERDAPLVNGGWARCCQGRLD